MKSYGLQYKNMSHPQPSTWINLDVGVDTTNNQVTRALKSFHQPQKTMPARWRTQSEVVEAVHGLKTNPDFDHLKFRVVSYLTITTVVLEDIA